MRKNIIILVALIMIASMNFVCADSDFVHLNLNATEFVNGERLIVKGDTSFSSVNILISKPDGNPFYYRIHDKDTFTAGIPIDFPTSTSEAPLGIYTVRAGIGSIFDTTTLSLIKQHSPSTPTIAPSETPAPTSESTTTPAPSPTATPDPTATPASSPSLTSSPTTTPAPTSAPTATPYSNNPSSNKGSGGGSGGGGGGIILPVITPQPSQIPAPSKSVFKDLDNVSWARESINTLASAGIINGRSAETFDPQNSISRAEFVKIIVKSFGITGKVNMAFSDVKDTDWFYLSVNSAVATGIINGLSQDAFDPNASITREQAAAILYRAVKLKKIALPQINNSKSFDDEISGWALDAVNSLQTAGVINGKGANLFAPKDNLTRAEAAKIIYGVYKLTL